jgi:DNA-directed RNA polymerase specialized sigma24 family protein
MKHESSVTQESFDSLLAWLDPDRDRAAGKYELIRRGLIKFFTCRRRHDAEELADETINRVTVKASEVAKNYVGDPTSYFHGVATKVWLESLRKKPPPPAPDLFTPDETAEVERQDACLERCMEEVTPANRKMLVDYYRYDGRAKINNRKEMATQLGIAPNALRIRVLRIRAVVQECVFGCLAEEQTA